MITLLLQCCAKGVIASAGLKLHTCAQKALESYTVKSKYCVWRKFGGMNGSVFFVFAMFFISLI